MIDEIVKQANLTGAKDEHLPYPYDGLESLSKSDNSDESYKSEFPYLLRYLLPFFSPSIFLYFLITLFLSFLRPSPFRFPLPSSSPFSVLLTFSFLHPLLHRHLRPFLLFRCPYVRQRNQRRCKGVTATGSSAPPRT